MENLDYGIIGNCRSAALISKTGSLDWCCLPQFDSTSVFAKLLDDEKGGSFEIRTASDYTIHQEYYRNTAILVTRYTNGGDVFEVHDFMPRHHKLNNGKYNAPPEIVRFVKYISGTPRFSVYYDPRLEYGLGSTTHYVKANYIVSLTHKQKFDTLFLYTSFNKNSILDGGEIILKEDGFFSICCSKNIIFIYKTYL